MKIFKLPFYVLLCLLSFSTLIKAQTAIVDTYFNDSTIVDQANTTSIDYSTDSSKFQLQTGEKENLAKGHYAYIVYKGTPPNKNGLLDTVSTNGLRVIDGQPTFISILDQNAGKGGDGTYIVIDLQAVRTIKRVVIKTFAGNSNLRPRAFSIFAGLDTLSMEKVFENPKNDSINAVAAFDPIVAKYIIVSIDIIPNTYNTTISEIEVYGEGYLPEGTLFSSVKEVNRNVNFGTLEFDGNVPGGTSVTFNVRTGSSPQIDSTWSDWSGDITKSGELFNAYEPRKYLQYRATLETKNLLTPVINEVRINYDTLVVASEAVADISPQYIPILKETNFTLTVNASFNANDFGIDTLQILTPSPSELNNVLVNGQPAAYLSKITAKKITIVFNSTIKNTATIQVGITATPYLAENSFITEISSNKVNNNFQQVDSKKTNGTEAWTVITTGVPEKLLVDTKAEPNPFTPNNDGINDKTNLSFFVGNIGEPKGIIGNEKRHLTIKIYDLSGRLVKDLLNNKTSSFAYIADSSVEWDGRDNSGSLVRPGVYIFQVFIDSDNGGEAISKTVVVSY